MAGIPGENYSWGLALISFVLLFPMFMRMPLKIPGWAHIGIKLIAYLLAFMLMINVKYADGRVWSLDFSNIIILLLANMAIFGSIVYIFTRNNRLARIAVLIFLMAILLSSEIEGSWAQVIFNYTPVPCLEDQDKYCDQNS